MTSQAFTIGIIGGGQLGRMLAMAAAQLGFRVVILEPDINAPAAQVANDQIISAYDDEIALQHLAQQCNVVTYEFENVPVKAIEFVQKTCPVYPGARALKISQDRLFEKQMIEDIGAETARFCKIASFQDLQTALSDIGYPAILKTRRLGYDGKGQARLDSDQDIKPAFDSITGISGNHVSKTGQTGHKAILEAFIDFDCEISVIAARSADGVFQAFDIAENTHRNHILYTSKIPANIHKNVALKGIKITKKIAEHLEYIGVLAVEFFVKRAQSSNFQIYVNEIAPRVHNSGHWTEAACVISQFEQHIRAITGLSLGNGKRHSDCIMQNLIGDEIKKISDLARQDNIKIHLYGKKDIRAGRKMGHVTFLKNRIDG